MKPDALMEVFDEECAWEDFWSLTISALSYVYTVRSQTYIIVQWASCYPPTASHNTCTIQWTCTSVTLVMRPWPRSRIPRNTTTSDNIMCLQVRYQAMLNLELLMGSFAAIYSVAVYFPALFYTCGCGPAADLEEHEADNDVLRLADRVIKSEGPGATRALDERIHTEKQLSWAGKIPAGGLAFDMFFICDDVLGMHTQATFSLDQPAV